MLYAVSSKLLEAHPQQLESFNCLYWAPQLFFDRRDTTVCPDCPVAIEWAG